jgi:prophage regulatory protein
MADWTQKGKEPSGEARSHAPTQPIEAAAVPGSMLRIATVTAITGLSKRTIYRMMAGGEFPQSVHLSPRCTAWRQGDVAGWVTSLGAA